MERVRRFFYYVCALDPTLTSDQRLARWADIAALAGIPVTLLTGAIGAWLFSNPWIGVVVGLGIWNLALSGLVALRRLQPSTSSQPPAESKPENAASQPTPTDTDSLQEQDRENQQFGRAAVVLGTDERPLVEDDEVWEKTYEHRSLWMAEFARKTAPSGETQALIRDRRFYDCHIYGPVVFGLLAPDELDKVFVDCEWTEDEEAVSWTPSENHQEYVGAVRLEDCRFERCRLSRIGVLKQEDPSPVERLTAERDASKEEGALRRTERDAQVRALSFHVSEWLDKFLDECKQEGLQEQEGMRRYNQQLSDKSVGVINDLKKFGLWNPKEEDQGRFEYPENRQDVDDLSSYLRWVGLDL